MLKRCFSIWTWASRAAGYEPGKDLVFAMDAAASELYDKEKDAYAFPGESRMKGERIFRSSGELVEYYRKLIGKYPLASIEDGLEENDWEGWKQMTETLGNAVQLVGDDLFVTNPKRLKKGIRMGAGNALLVKMNQIGTLTETFEAVELAKRGGYRCIASHSARRDGRHLSGRSFGGHGYRPDEGRSALPQ